MQESFTPPKHIMTEIKETVKELEPSVSIIFLLPTTSKMCVRPTEGFHELLPSTWNCAQQWCRFPRALERPEDAAPGAQMGRGSFTTAKFRLAPLLLPTVRKHLACLQDVRC